MAGDVPTPLFKAEGRYGYFEAGGNVNLGRIVYMNQNAEVLNATASHKATALGVASATRRFSRTSADNIAKDGEMVTVVLRGRVKVIANSAITAGALVEAANNGRVTTHTAASANYDRVFGMALTSAAAAGDDVEILIQKNSML